MAEPPVNALEKSVEDEALRHGWKPERVGRFVVYQRPLSEDIKERMSPSKKQKGNLWRYIRPKNGE